MKVRCDHCKAPLNPNNMSICEYCGFPTGISDNPRQVQQQLEQAKVEQIMNMLSQNLSKVAEDTKSLKLKN